jgi:16S rRNA processing protein RimM
VKPESADNPAVEPAALAGRVVLAEIHRERGNRGEVLARSLTDIPGRLENLKSAWVQFAGGTDQAVVIEKVWRHQENWVLKFAGVDSISDAERFRGADLWVPRNERAPLPEGEYYESDLLGFEVRDAASGEAVGIVQGWRRFGGPPLLEVECSGREALIPFVPAICRKVDLERRMVEVDLPEGLLEL